MKHGCLVVILAIVVFILCLKVFPLITSIVTGIGILIGGIIFYALIHEPKEK